MGKTTVQKLLGDHGLVRRAQRVARAAAVAAATTGLVTEAAAEECRCGFCHWAAGPGGLVALDSFYIGNLKGVGRVYQLTAIDTATRWAVVAIVLGTPDGTVTARFLEAVVRRWRRFGFGVRAVLTDNGPEYIAAGFRAALVAKGIGHVRIPPRTPTTAAVLHQHAPAAGRRRRVAGALQHPSAQPRRLHAWPHTAPSPRLPPHQASSMTTSHRPSLSPRTPARKR
ncbi:MAG TPA: DDE-type integrase/transposase/recombinase [Acidimicrobiales bacterium]|nr:DDE-type integrase/transposase/recombinase [Acidimicrobiales bacterium]